MKNKSIRITFRYALVIIAVAVLVLILNYSLFLLLIKDNSLFQEPTKTVKLIAQEFNESETGLTPQTIQMIQQNHLWVQLIDLQGDVISSCNAPEDLVEKYTLKDIAVLSKSYLNGYPVYLWESGENFVMLGYPRNSMVKYNWSFPNRSTGSFPTTLLLIASVNLAVIIILSIFFSRRITKPISNIAEGITLLKEEKDVELHEGDVFEDLANSINHTSRLIREKNEKIKLKDTAVSNWLTGISHDIRTPLSMVLGYAGLMEEDKALPDETRAQAKIITENTVRIKNLIENLNLAHSLQHQLMPINLKPVKLANIARKALTECVNTGILQNHSYEICIEDEQVSALLDETLFLRALTNLITNSVKHNREGCGFTIAVPPAKDGQACVVISDTGAGIPADIIERLNQQDYLNAWAKQTHGLGLIIAKSIIEIHHGQLTLESESGKGTVITIRLFTFRSIVMN
ncbi:MAG: HAMP domain-containing histidine kinase [Thermoclostridium sp.]|nr:HAMP domain-containing histidine kinase [Thermoclostridium sp.]